MSSSSIDAQSRDCVLQPLRPSECQFFGFVPSLSFLPTSTVYATAYIAGLFQPDNRSWGSLRFMFEQQVSSAPSSWDFRKDVVSTGCSTTPRQRFTLRSFSLSTSVSKTFSETLHLPLICLDGSNWIRPHCELAGVSSGIHSCSFTDTLL